MEIFAFTMTFLVGVFVGGNAIVLIALWLENREQTKQLNTMPPPDPKTRVPDLVSYEDHVGSNPFVN